MQASVGMVSEARCPQAGHVIVETRCITPPAKTRLVGHVRNDLDPAGTRFAGLLALLYDASVFSPNDFRDPQSLGRPYGYRLSHIAQGQATSANRHSSGLPDAHAAAPASSDAR